MPSKEQCGGCGCSLTGGRKRKRTRKQGGSMVGDALLAGSALGLYSYFTRSKRGGRKVLRRKTKKVFV